MSAFSIEFALTAQACFFESQKSMNASQYGNNGGSGL